MSFVTHFSQVLTLGEKKIWAQTWHLTGSCSKPSMGNDGIIEWHQRHRSTRSSETYWLDIYPDNSATNNIFLMKSVCSSLPGPKSINLSTNQQSVCISLGTIAIKVFILELLWWANFSKFDSVYISTTDVSISFSLFIYVYS